MKTEDCPRCDDKGVLTLGGVAAAAEAAQAMGPVIAAVSMPCPYCDAWEAAGKPPEGRAAAWKACQNYRATEIVISNAERILAAFAEGKSDLYRLGIVADGMVRLDALRVEVPPWGRVLAPVGFAKP